MGNSQSIFYPDNPKRRDRAQQLANDCQSFKQTFDNKHADLENILGPYKAKLDRVLSAFGCTNLDDLDRVVQQRATGKALEDWNKTKDVYDKTQIVDQVIMGAMGTIAIAGLAISTVGALAGGFGFFVGLAVTADILLVLGIIGAIFDIINGAIQRSKLRDAINSLFENRIKIKQVLAHIDNLYVWLPSIKDIYETYEEAGYSPEKIIERFKTKGLMKPLQSDLHDATFHKAATDLNELDQSRGSWTNEDPNWQDIVNKLEPSSASGVVSLVARAAFDKEEDKSQPWANSIKINLSASDPEKARFASHVELFLLQFLDGKSAEVLLRTAEQYFVSVDQNGKIVPSNPANATHWTATLENAIDGVHSPSELRTDPTSVQVKATISAYSGGNRWYLDANGDIISDVHGAETLYCRYA